MDQSIAKVAARRDGMGVLRAAAVAALIACPSHSLADTPAANMTFTTFTPSRSGGRFALFPIAFEPNLGQSRSSAKFLSRGGRQTLLLDERGLILVDGSREVLRVRLLGANPQPAIVGRQELSGRVSYLIGADRDRWLTGVPTFARVEYRGVYPHIDMAVYGRERQIEYDWIVAPGGDPSQIRLGVPGTAQLRLDGGDLLVETPGGALRLREPCAYQERGGTREAVAARYRLDPPGSSEGTLETTRSLGLSVGSYDPALPLIIDPVLSYSTFLGGSGNDAGHAVAVDALGNVYVAGQTESVDFPTTVPFQTPDGVSHAYIVELDPTGTQLIYATYLGGTAGVVPFDQMGLVVDALGNAYLTGETASPDFPTVNPLQASIGGAFDAFVTKLDPRSGSLRYSTHLGGAADEEGLGIAADEAGNAYVTGWTTSSDFPVASPLQPVRGGSFDAFLAKLDPQGSSLVYSTYLGGEGQDYSFDVALDGAGNVYLVGGTSSTDFPIRNPVQLHWAGGPLDSFLTKIDPDGSQIVFSTYLGGSSDENPQGIGLGVAVDGAGDAYVVGSSRSADFPTRNAFQGGNQGGLDAFVTKVGRTSPGTGVDLVVSLKEVGGDTLLGLSLGNGGTAPAQIELKLWLELAKTDPVSMLDNPTKVIVIPRQALTELFSLPLPDGLKFPGTTIAARLVDRVTGVTIRDSFCTAVPCNAEAAP